VAAKRLVSTTAAAHQQAIGAVALQLGQKHRPVRLVLHLGPQPIAAAIQLGDAIGLEIVQPKAYQAFGREFVKTVDIELKGGAGGSGNGHRQGTIGAL
jgi:hypothetical protein